MIEYENNPLNFINYKDQIYNFLDNVRNFYSNFDNWYNRFCDEILLGKRGYIIALDNNKIVGILLYKFDPLDKKICTIKVKESYRRRGIGKELVNKMFIDFNPDYITIPGGIKETKETCEFIINFQFYLIGIKNISENKHELIFGKVYFGDKSASIILSIKKYWSEKIKLGEKLVEFRKKKLPSTEYIFINETEIKPSKIIGYFSIKQIIEDSPENIWNNYNSVGSIDYESFFKYFSEREIGYAIIIDKYFDLGIDSKKLLGNNFNSPQFFKYL